MKKEYQNPRVKVVIVDTQSPVMNLVSGNFDETGEG